MAAIKRVIIDPCSKGDPLAQKVIADANVPVAFMNRESLHTALSELSLSEGKNTLFLTRFEGKMVKACPSTRLPYLCCRYTTINQIMQCPIDCTYCILQDYLELPLITAYTNLDDILFEIDALLEGEPDRLFRFGTGELGDSLAVDPILQLSGWWVQSFGKKQNALIELKTKSANIESLPSLCPGNSVISWSVNPEFVIRSDERGAASLSARIKAACSCQQAGYLIGFHFDPVLWTDGWEDRYHTVIDRIADSVNADRIAWISLGTLRFPLSLKNIAYRRFPQNRLMAQEMIQGLDGKMRYPRPMREKLYTHLVGLLRERLPGVFLYFCMEMPDVWRSVLGAAPESNAELDFWFAESLFERFPELSMTKPLRHAYT